MLNKLVIVHPHLTVKGGSERLTRVLVHELHNLGVDVYVVTSDVDTEWFSSEDVRVIRISRDETTNYAVARAMALTIEAINPDVVLVMIQEPYYCYVAKTFKEDVITCMYVHFPLDEEISEENIDEYTKFFRYPHLTANCLKYVDKILVNSRRTKLAVKFLWGLDAEVVYPCLDPIFFTTQPPLGTEREPTLLYVGRFNTLKRHDFLILTFPLIKEEVPNAKLVLTGYVDPRHREYFEYVRSVVEKIQDKCKDIELIPTPSEEKLLELYREAKVYVHPRVGEHFGLAPLEAMSQGTPAVVRAPTGLSEVIEHEVHGYIAWSDLELVKYVVHVLKMDRENWSKLQLRAYECAQRFKPKVFAENIIKVLSQ